MRIPLSTSRRLAVLAVAILAPLAAACGGETSQPAPTAAAAPATGSEPALSLPKGQAKPTEASAAKPTAASSPQTAAAASPASSPAPSPAAAAKPAPSPAASPAASAGAAGSTRLALAPEGNEARYRAQEQLTGRALPNEAVGATKGVTGAIVLGPNGAIVPAQSKITVDLAQLTSDQSRRDNWIKRNTLAVAQFPNAEFVPREARGLPGPLPTSGEAPFELLGDLTVRGVTKPTTWTVNAQFTEGQVTGQARTRVKMTDFGMEPPRVGPVLSLDDELTLEIDFRAARE